MSIEERAICLTGLKQRAVYDAFLWTKHGLGAAGRNRQAMVGEPDSSGFPPQAVLARRLRRVSDTPLIAFRRKVSARFTGLLCAAGRSRVNAADR